MKYTSKGVITKLDTVFDWTGPYYKIKLLGQDGAEVTMPHIPYREVDFDTEIEVTVEFKENKEAKRKREIKAKIESLEGELRKLRESI